MATRRKFGAIRYGFILAATLAANQTIPVDPLVISVSLGQADAPTPGTSIRAIPYQRPVAQRGIQRFGFLPGTAASDATLSANSLTTTVSLPTATVAPGAVSLSTSPLITTVSLPAAAGSAGGVSLATSPLIGTVSLPTATLSAATAGVSIPVPFRRPVFQRGLRWYGPPSYTATPESDRTLAVDPLSVTVSLPTAVRSAGAVSLTTTPLVTSVALPTSAASGGAVSLSTSPLVATVSLPTATLSAASTSIPVPFRRAVGQRGYRYYGPPSYSTTPESDRTLTTDPLVVSVSLPTAALASAGDPRLPAEYFRIRTVKPTRTARSSRILAHGMIEQLAPEDRTLTTSPLIATVSLPTATAASTTLERQVPELKRLRLVRQRPFTEPRTSPLVNRHGYLKPPPAGTAQGLSVSTLNLAVSLPTATASAGAVSVSTTPLVVTVSLPTAALNAGGGTALSTSPLVATVSLPTAAVSAGAATVATTPLGTTVSLPAAAVSAGAVTRTVTPLAVSVSLPTAISTRALPVSAIGTSVSLPTATLVAGTAPVSASPLVVTVSLPAPRVLGATTLPDMVKTTLESRMAERILTDRRGKRLVDKRNGDRIVEFNG